MKRIALVLAAVLLSSATFAMAEGAWKLVDVKDKDGAMKKIWACEGRLLCLYVDDKQSDDVTGDGKGGVWHVAKAEMTNE